jgi:beta-lactamase superfamily II metal-dependent hydrolase
LSSRWVQDDSVIRFRRNVCLPKKVRISSSTLKVYAIGGGYGEAILINIGDTIIIGIDSCQSLISPGLQGTQSPLDAVLDKIGKYGIGIWALSHPHRDHFQGILSVSKKLIPSLSRVILPLSYTARDVGRRLLLAAASSENAPRIAISLADDEYSELSDILFSEENNSIHSPGVSGQVIWSGDLVRNGTSWPFSIRVIAPDYANIKQVEDEMMKKGLKAILDDEEEIRWTRDVGNRWSTVLVLEIAKLRLVLSGDADAAELIKAWRKTYGCCHNNTILKISHHGSMTGSSKLLISTIWKEPKGRYAFLCPFESIDLPNSEIVKMYKKAGILVYQTGRTQAARIARVRNYRRIGLQKTERGSSNERILEITCHLDRKPINIKAKNSSI